MRGFAPLTTIPGNGYVARIPQPTYTTITSPESTEPDKVPVYDSKWPVWSQGPWHLWQPRLVVRVRC